MRFKNLYETWSGQGTTPLSDDYFKIRLPIDDVARVEALAEMFPHRGVDGIISDMLSVALRDMEENFPYVQGSRVIGYDEEGNPQYEDIGPTPRYLELLQKHGQTKQSA